LDAPTDGRLPVVSEARRNRTEGLGGNGPTAEVGYSGLNDRTPQGTIEHFERARAGSDAYSGLCAFPRAAVPWRAANAGGAPCGNKPEDNRAPRSAPAPTIAQQPRPARAAPARRGSPTGGSQHVGPAPPALEGL